MRVIPPLAYFEHVDRYSEEHGECPIFVATDQVQFLDQMRERYGERVLALDAIRTKGAFNTFQTPDEKTSSRAARSFSTASSSRGPTSSSSARRPSGSTPPTSTARLRTSM